MCEFKTSAITISSQKYLEKMVTMLILHSQWFAVMPLPDDEWELSVKNEEYSRYIKIYKELKGPHVEQT